MHQATDAYHRSRSAILQRDGLAESPSRSADSRSLSFSRVQLQFGQDSGESSAGPDQFLVGTTKKGRWSGVRPWSWSDLPRTATADISDADPANLGDKAMGAAFQGEMYAAKLRDHQGSQSRRNANTHKGKAQREQFSKARPAAAIAAWAAAVPWPLETQYN